MGLAGSIAPHVTLLMRDGSRLNIELADPLRQARDLTACLAPRTGNRPGAGDRVGRSLHLIAVDGGHTWRAPATAGRDWPGEAGAGETGAPRGAAETGSADGADALGGASRPAGVGAGQPSASARRPARARVVERRPASAGAAHHRGLAGRRRGLHDGGVARNARAELPAE